MQERRGVTHPSTRRRPQGPTGSTRRSAGFTLIELLIAVAVIGILASIAYPSYQRYVKEARVADGKAKVVEVMSQLERCYTVTSTYTKRGDGGDCVDFTGLTSEEGYYSIEAFGVNGSEVGVQPSGYRLVAEAVEANKVACSELWVDSLGNRGSVPDGCW